MSSPTEGTYCSTVISRQQTLKFNPVAGEAVLLSISVCASYQVKEEQKFGRLVFLEIAPQRKRLGIGLGPWCLALFFVILYCSYFCFRSVQSNQQAIPTDKTWSIGFCTTFLLCLLGVLRQYYWCCDPSSAYRQTKMNI